MLSVWLYGSIARTNLTLRTTLRPPIANPEHFPSKWSFELGQAEKPEEKGDDGTPGGMPPGGMM
jgi:hypothetical protein